MRIYSVNTMQPRNYSKPNLNKSNETKSQVSVKNSNNQLAFKGDMGALKGFAIGSIVGLGAAAATIAIGGLATIVAAIGVTGATIAGAAAGGKIGAIIGGYSSDD